MKKVISLLLITVLLLSLTACHGRRVQRTEESAEAPAASSIYQIPDSFDTSRN